ncbi:hypothetical protein [Endozoicomonas numazuensis]|uniref:Lipoprotein n=1 Tax=Endozoicomonas numazuensis TaxID=1137799 RepID=A0A081NLE5_9GAMM|nr:hypothetical protein [Endozoicomonas numazuensis]KEQ19268.1 hypothetical protein GZ78_04600 [Endozoicomonas numazuensis]
MKYPALVFLFPVLLLLMACDARQVPERKEKLDEAIVTRILEARLTAIIDGEVEKIKGFYSPDVDFKVTNVKGIQFNQGYKVIKQQAELNAVYGIEYQEDVLERFIFITNEFQKAIVEQRAHEIWLYRERFNDISITAVTRTEIELIQGVPQITKVHKMILSRSILNEDRRGSMSTLKKAVEIECCGQ